MPRWVLPSSLSSGNLDGSVTKLFPTPAAPAPPACPRSLGGPTSSWHGGHDPESSRG